LQQVGPQHQAARNEVFPAEPLCNMQKCYMFRKIVIPALLIFSQGAYGADDEAKKRADGARLALVMTFEKCTDLKCLEPILDSAANQGATQEMKALSKSVLDEVCKKKADLCAKIPNHLAEKDKKSKEEQSKIQAAIEEQKKKLKPSDPVKESLRPQSETDKVGKPLVTAEEAKKSIPPPPPPPPPPAKKDQDKK